EVRGELLVIVQVVLRSGESIDVSLKWFVLRDGRLTRELVRAALCEQGCHAEEVAACHEGDDHDDGDQGPDASSEFHFSASSSPSAPSTPIWAARSASSFIRLE